MSGCRTKKLNRKYDLTSQSKAIDRVKDLRVSPLEGFKDEICVQGMKGFVDFVAEKYGDQPCFGHRNDFGSAVVWNTYKQTRRDILAFGSALRSILPSRATVGLYGRNLPEWVYSQLACGYYGLVTVPLYDTLGEEALHHILNQTEISLVVCDTSERAESIIKQGSEYVRYLVVIKMDEDDRQKLMKNTKDSVAIFTFAEMVVRGLGKEEDVPEISVIGNLHVSFLPLAHIFEQLAMATCLTYGSQIAFLTTDVTRLIDDYAYYRPTVLALVPRVLSRMYAAVMEKVNSSKIKARLFERAIKSKLEEQKRGIFKQCGILDSLCFRPIRNRFGGRVRVIICASAPLQPEVFRFTKSAFSCPVIEAYGSTESGGLITLTLPTDIIGGHAGSIAPDMKIKLIDVPSMGFTVKRDGIGEICVLSPANTPGYYKESEKTKELFDEDGFVRMGDIGRWTEYGTLQIVDRCKNIFKLSQGEYVAPEKVEQVYALSPLVLNVYVDGNPLYSYTVAVVVPNFEKLEKQFSELFAELLRENNGIESDSKKYFAEACQQKKLAKLILNEINKLGAEKGLKGFEQVRDLHLSPEPFSIENGLLTPTMKIARPQIRNHFAAQIQALYAAGNS
ncbi:hypothetical protein CRM22_000512 [Opisthorchis felineus]|uniref:long-chain-fatty-acid--CoA ligase n=2 Tax=Opisthorchis felineus TaxID=147828 RepID=A0A4S2MLI7_OPIFE|nr:hypothetical protein CRM22_000512 [Opisthorchis felineus]